MKEKALTWLEASDTKMRRFRAPESLMRRHPAHDVQLGERKKPHPLLLFRFQAAQDARTGHRPRLPIPFLRAGYVDFLPYVYTDMNLNNRSISYRVSDHYPLWAEFSNT